MESARRDARPVCVRCCQVLGVYEPIVVVRPDGRPRRTSIADDGLPLEGEAMHEVCYASACPEGP